MSSQKLDYVPAKEHETKHHLTMADTMKGANASKAVRSLKKRFHFEKALKKLGIEGVTTVEIIKLLGASMTSPVVAGTGSYLLVALLEMLTNSYYASTATAQQRKMNSDVSNVINLITSSLPPGLSQAFGLGAGLSQSQLAGGNPLTVDFYALKGVILVYIASGGNLAGLLGSVSGFLKAGAGASAASGLP